ncbi:MAG: hypothetical protein GY760_09150, partial [Deltaproteobacteria bacterium]|nr:hypothetical protein [Deltaproteobacteria bacterium]
MDYNNIKEYITNLVSETSLRQSIKKFDIEIDGLKKYRNIIIYGAGGWGIELQKLLKVYSVEIDAFFDQRADEIKSINNTPVYSIDMFNTEESDKHNYLVIVATKLESQNSIITNLKKCGFLNFRRLSGLWYYGCWSNKAELLSLIDEKEKILDCLELFDDNKSLNIFYSQISCYISRSYNIQNQIDDDQYFPEDIVFSKGYSDFVDCGAYNGDTVASLLNKVG